MLLIRIHAERPVIGGVPIDVPDPGKAAVDRTPAQLYRWVVGMGWGEEIAASWVAWRVGLPPTSENGFAPWTLPSIAALLFMRQLVRSGDLAGDTSAQPE